MMIRRVQIANPANYKQTLTIMVKVTTSDPSVEVTDLLFQPGTTATGWVPAISEMPWTTGVVS
ncbi:hypothetical protein PBI_STINGRAY_20 [Microbacterium phage StingRay]|uniref:Uncharacterized protein n=60 Tax=Ilzatvirus TaxID=2560150 RepID=A0A5J6TL98_9CAUD|nr:hypothetical protein FDJ36_gp20 [Microbacterium phage Ilzat]AVJ49222.1 hypothetical protein PBI_BONINO_20 [Microbacterium phage Bonino]AVJ51217.1 hypothetical protein SEA_PUPPYEGGO_20 [Microbacterium phage PuppyEggo]AVJ51465.1 hypothetical protein PBI_STINGRAY_20 [Microbacterium phage StingRay]AVO24411.1 hypothetical protein PBI_ADLER_20 [Microbacterium phage AlexAdler]AVR56349.1 hypothetical protein PBI_NAGEM_20 [Microbacterium phage Nagem]AVR56500.1 hypothetical protein PBI_ROBINSON_20 [